MNIKTLVGLFAISCFVSVSYSCMSHDPKRSSSSSENMSQEDIAKGLELMKINCYSCHNPEAKEESRLAPPFFAVKNHYMKDEPSLDEFTKEMIDFICNPSEEKSKMKGAIEKFNLMPQLSYQEEDLKKIAAYLYHTELEHPKGHQQHKKVGKGHSETDPIEKGQEIALKTKKILGKNLIGAINAKGTVAALNFCSEKAIHLTDSMSQELNAKVKRVSDKNRNPNNAASESELAYIEESKELIAKGEQAKPQLLKEGDRYIGYYPIMTNQMCLQCHGEPKKDILEGTLAKIEELYPTDKAKGYGENQLRGIWVVEMDQ